MIIAEEARELSNRIKEYKNKLQDHLNKIEKDIRYHALFTEDKSILYEILDINDLYSLTIDLSNMLEGHGYKVEIVENGIAYNTIQISW